jgi:hypothetical protein
VYDLLKPRVTKVVVCDPRRNALLQEGNQNDRVDARKLAELLHHNQLRSVYHGDHGLRTLKELVRSYIAQASISAACPKTLGIAAAKSCVLLTRNVGARLPTNKDCGRFERRRLEACREQGAEGIHLSQEIFHDGSDGPIEQ